MLSSLPQLQGSSSVNQAKTTRKIKKRFGTRVSELARFGTAPAPAPEMIRKSPAPLNFKKSAPAPSFFLKLAPAPAECCAKLH